MLLSTFSSPASPAFMPPRAAPNKTKQNLWSVVMRFEKLRLKWRFFHLSLRTPRKIELWFVLHAVPFSLRCGFLKLKSCSGSCRTLTLHKAHTLYKSSFPCFSIIKQARRVNFGWIIQSTWLYVYTLCHVVRNTLDCFFFLDRESFWVCDRGEWVWRAFDYAYAFVFLLGFNFLNQFF